MAEIDPGSAGDIVSGKKHGRVVSNTPKKVRDENTEEGACLVSKTSLQACTSTAPSTTSGPPGGSSADARNTRSPEGPRTRIKPLLVFAELLCAALYFQGDSVLPWLWAVPARVQSAGDSFVFDSRLPLASWDAAVPCAIYVVLAVCASRSVRSLRSIKAASVIHNIIMVVISAVVCVNMLYETALILHAGTFEQEIVCPSPKARTGGRMYMWYYIFYLSKFYEWMDTLLLALKGKTIIPLHMWHHFSVVPITLISMHSGIDVALWALTTFNSLVHTFMYYYYLCSTLGFPCGWKKLLTQLQICQFVAGSFGGPWFLWLFFKEVTVDWVSVLGMQLPVFYSGACRGDLASIFLGMGVNLTMLGGFTSFFRSAYKAKPKSKRE